jgi:hypothetical protein
MMKYLSNEKVQITLIVIISGAVFTWMSHFYTQNCILKYGESVVRYSFNNRACLMEDGSIKRLNESWWINF